MSRRSLSPTVSAGPHLVPLQVADVLEALDARCADAQQVGRLAPCVDVIAYTLEHQPGFLNFVDEIGTPCPEGFQIWGTSFRHADPTPQYTTIRCKDALIRPYTAR